jgi:hypothetical protein
VQVVLVAGYYPSKLGSPLFSVEWQRAVNSLRG